MNTYKIKLSKTALKDKKLLEQTNLIQNVEKILDLLIENPYFYPPSYEKLIGRLNGYYSRRINSQHRLVYTIDDIKKEIHIHRMWTHYDKI